VSAPGLPALLVTHWQVSAAPTAGAAAVALAYLRGVRRIDGAWPVRHTLGFLAGIGCVLVALESGIAAYDDRLLWAHMAQHMLLLLIAPLLLLGGRPVILTLRAMPRRGRPGLVATLTRLRRVTGPVACVTAFAAVVIATHVPSFYDAALRDPPLHQLEHALYLLAGTLLWWPILDGDPVPGNRLGGLGRLGYIVVAMAPMALVGAYLNRDPALLYAPYGPGARALGLAPLTDQAQAGAIMWVGGDVVMVAVGLWAALSALVAEERRQQRGEQRSATLGASRPELWP
jgi:cytochrome c oxidase assembly factor CtaG